MKVKTTEPDFTHSRSRPLSSFTEIQHDPSHPTPYITVFSDDDRTHRIKQTNFRLRYYEALNVISHRRENTDYIPESLSISRSDSRKIENKQARFDGWWDENERDSSRSLSASKAAARRKFSDEFSHIDPPKGDECIFELE